MITGCAKIEILMNIESYEKRVAVLDNGTLQEIHIERQNQQGIVGNIYKGRIQRVLPGMQAAFVDIGLERAGFLHVADVMPICSDEQEAIDLNSAEADVRKWLCQGQELLVQVLKEPLGTKGARLTAHLSLASRYLVYMPDLNHIGISLRLTNETERQRLQDQMQQALENTEPKGFIVRTVAEGVAIGALKKDILFLQNLWQDILDTACTVTNPGLVYQDLNLPMRIIRDIATQEVDEISIDDADTYSALCNFADKFVPGARDKMHLYQSHRLLFDRYGIEQDLEKALDRQVNLKSGGYLVIDQTEAMTTIDVNTGGYVGKVNLEETIFKTNLEAAHAIGRQLRLRNLGGIIVIDFIDMNQQEHKQAVMDALENVLAHDSARTTVMPMSDLGLVEMTRKRTQESLSKFLCQPCDYCHGRGRIKTAQTICYEIFREIQREAFSFNNHGFLIVGAPDVIETLKNDESIGLGELELAIEKPIQLKAEPSYRQEAFEIALL